jgi:hypothetical protein
MSHGRSGPLALASGSALSSFGSFYVGDIGQLKIHDITNGGKTRTLRTNNTNDLRDNIASFF